MTNRDKTRQGLINYLEYLKMSGAEYLQKISLKAAPFNITGEVGITDQREDMAEGSAPGRLDDIRKELGDCKRCGLAQTRTHLVFGVGSPDADLVFVGEAPGRDEDLNGEPFVGRAGQLLTRIIEAIDLKRSDVYICNVIKCRPPENRNPLPGEIEACEPFLLKQLEAIRPKVICTLGKFAAQTLLKTNAPISTFRGRFYSYHGIPIMPTYHPAYLLRNPSMKRQVWEDVQKAQKVLKGESKPALL